jgi:hypothetical protein
VALLATLAACCALGASLFAGGAGATNSAKDFSFDCDIDAIHVTQTGNRLDARGRLRCAGSGVRRQVIRVCLMQASPRGPVVVKCVVKARSGTGLVSAVSSRRCGRGPSVGFITRVQVRIKQTDGDVATDTARSSPNRLPRDCV